MHSLKKRKRRALSIERRLSLLSSELCLFSAEQRVCDTLRGFHSGAVDQVRVPVAGRGDLRVSELLGYRNDIRAVGNQHTCDGVSEGVRVDRRQIMSVGEFACPCRDAGWVHRFAVFLCEEVTGVFPSVTTLDALFGLFGTVPL